MNIKCFLLYLIIIAGIAQAVMLEEEVFATLDTHDEVQAMRRIAQCTGLGGIGVCSEVEVLAIDQELFASLYEKYHPAFLCAPEGFAWDGCESRHQH